MFCTAFPFRVAVMAIVALLIIVVDPVPVAAQKRPSFFTVDPALFSGMRYRMAGPFRGGRVTAVTGIAEKPHTFFQGASGGGVWKTDDAGHHWIPIADEFLTAGAEGAIDVADSDANVI